MILGKGLGREKPFSVPQEPACPSAPVSTWEYPDLSGELAEFSIAPLGFYGVRRGWGRLLWAQGSVKCLVGEWI